MFILLLRNMTISKINFIYTFGNTTKQISTKFQYLTTAEINIREIFGDPRLENYILPLIFKIL